MADDDDEETTPGGEQPFEGPRGAGRRRGGADDQDDDDDVGQRGRDEEDRGDTLPAPSRLPPAPDGEDLLPATGAHEVVFPPQDDEGGSTADRIPSFEEYRRSREGRPEETEPLWRNEDDEGDLGRVEGLAGRPDRDPEHEYAERMFAGEHRGQRDDEGEGGDTLDGEHSLEGVTFPPDADEGDSEPRFAGTYEEELAREAADLFPTGYEHTAEEIHERRLEAHRRHRRNGRIRLVILVIVLALIVFAAVHELGGSGKPAKTPPAGPATPTSAGTGRGFLQKGSDPGVLPANLLISDWGSHQLLVISPQGQVVWTYHPSASYKLTLKPDYAFFTRSGKQIVMTEESNSRIEVLNVAGRQVVFTYGHYGKPGSAFNYLHDPSAAIQEGSEVLINDIRNCRILVMRPPHHAIVRTLGRAGACKHDPPTTFDSPVSAFPLRDGGTVVTELGSASIDLLNASGKLQRSFTVPGLRLPAGVNQTSTGDLVAVDHTHPGAVEIFTDTGKVLWTYRARGAGELRDPAIAYVLPNGDVLVSDEYNDRVIVIDRKTQKIVWQYGRTGVPGGGTGYLDVPVGLDLVAPRSLLDQFPSASAPG